MKRDCDSCLAAQSKARWEAWYWLLDMLYRDMENDFVFNEREMDRDRVREVQRKLIEAVNLAGRSD